MFHPRPALFRYKQWLTRENRLTPRVAEALARAEEVREQKKFVVYCGGALTDATGAEKRRYVQTGAIAMKMPGFFGYVPHLHGTDPVQHPDVSPAEVRDIDFLWAVVMADLQVIMVSPIGIGFGIEIGWGESWSVPVVYCMPYDMRLSRLPRGVANLMHTFSYQAEDLLYVELSRTFEALARWRNQNPPSVPLKIFFEQFKK